MPQDPLNPQDPAETTKPAEPTPATPLPTTPSPAPATPQTGAGHVDLGKILLPKKEVPGQTKDSATRINAAVLLEQETTAGIEGTAAQTPNKPAEPAPEPTLPPQEESVVKSLETFQRDIESVVQNQNVSVLTIATAEAERRAHGGGTVDNPEGSAKTILRNTIMISAGLVFIVAASGALAYLLTRPTSVTPTPIVEGNSPFISVDGQKEITITNKERRDTFMASLNAARQATALSVGLMSQLVVSESSTTPEGTVLTPVPAQDFLALLAPRVPQNVLRALRPTYLLGVHVYNDNQAFLIASGYSYEQLYAAMLEWEPYIVNDLSPLFDYTPRPRIPEEGIATTSPSELPRVVASNFVDKIVENRDARVLQNEYGDISLMWTMLDRNTLVIATNEATLREIIARLKRAPTITLPAN